MPRLRGGKKSLDSVAEDSEICDCNYLYKFKYQLKHCLNVSLK